MADNILQVEIDLVENLINNLPTGYTQARVKLPNAPFDTPDNESWLRVTMNLAPKENVQASGSYKRQLGIFTVDIFMPKESYSNSGLSTFNEIKSIYENQRIGIVECEVVSPNIVGEDGSWYNIQADVNFYYQGV